VLGCTQSPGRGRAADRRQLDAICTRFPRLGERRRQMGTMLSGGEQQMLANARVLVGAPRPPLIDEPTEGLAPKIVDEIFTLMDGLRRDGIPILLVERNMHRAIGLVQRICVLEHGAVVMAGDGSQATDREALPRQLAV
jgi:branched-chain amino acid transport system ATP-binding protein